MSYYFICYAITKNRKQWDFIFEFIEENPLAYYKKRVEEYEINFAII